MFADDPTRVSALIIQNGNAYAEGLLEFWDPLKACWADPSKENGDALRGFLTRETTKWQFTHGAKHPDAISPAKGAHPYKRDLNNLEFHLLNGGHFALEEYGPEIAMGMRSFSARVIN